MKRLLAALAASLFFAAGQANAAPPVTSSVWVEVGGTPVTSVAYAQPFVVGYTTGEKKPWALVRCFPNASTVYTVTFDDGSVWGEYYSLYAGGPAPQAFILGDGYANWTGGGADCTVQLLKFNHDYSVSTVLAESAFTGTP